MSPTMERMPEAVEKWPGHLLHHSRHMCLVPRLYFPAYFTTCGKKSWEVESGNEATEIL